MSDARNFLQGMSNAAASTVSAPVDLSAWLLRKLGAGPLIGNAPVGGSDWMAQKGLTQPANGLAGQAGEFAGNLIPIAAAAKGPQIASALNKGVANALAPTSPGMAQRGAIVYHGSPHSFDAFDMSKIGTGEGAQAYGHGLYFAENPTVAGQYAKDLAASRQSMTNRQLAVTGGDIDKAIAESQAAIERLRALPNGGGDPARQAAQIGLHQEKLAELAKLKAGQQMSQPNLYKVDLPDEAIAKMLDWDKPLSQQHPDVQAALGQMLPKGVVNPHGLDMGGGGKILDNRMGQADKTQTQPWVLASGGKMFGLSQKDVDRMVADHGANMTGENAYTRLTAHLGGQPAATTALQKAGVPGLRYLDGGSRNISGQVQTARNGLDYWRKQGDPAKVAQAERVLAEAIRQEGAGTSNYVVFDAKLPKIMERNGQSLADQLADKLK